MYDQPTQSRSQLQRYVVPLMFLCLAVVPIVYYGFNSEVAKWNAARGQLLFDDGDVERGIELMEQAVEGSPNDQDLKLHLAQHLMQVKRADEALVLVEGVLEKSSDPRTGLEAKANCLLYLERPVEALESIKQHPDISNPRDNINYLNVLAYYRALAGKELEKATENIGKSIRKFRTDTWWLDKYPMALHDMVLLQASVLANRIDRTELVMDRLNRRIFELEEVLRHTQRWISEKVYRNMQRQWPPSEQQESTLYEKQLDLHSQKQILSLMYTIRALIYQKQGKIEPCDFDRISVANFDHDPELLLEYMPNDGLLMQLMYQGAQFLDTRAMVVAAKSDRNVVGGDIDDALVDLDVAVLALEILSLTHDTELGNSVDPQSGGFDKRTIGHVEATVRRHRQDVCERIGQSNKAAIDRQRIEDLGFDDEDILF